MLQAQPRVLALGNIHCADCFTPLPRGAPRHRSDDVQVAGQLLGRPHGNRFLVLDLAPGAQEQVRIPNEMFTYGGRPVAPGRIEHAHFLGAELIPGNLLGEAFAVIPLGARHRHQILHGGVRPDFPAADLLLDGVGQLTNQCQAARDPRHAPVEAPGEIVQTESKAAMQLGQQPSLFERRFCFGCSQGPIQYQRLSLVHIPDCSAHGVLAETLQRSNPLVAVDDQESVRLVSQSNDYDGNLLTPFGEGGQQTPFAIRTAHPKPLIAQIQLMKLKVHCDCPRFRGLTDHPISMFASMTMWAGFEQAVT